MPVYREYSDRAVKRPPVWFHSPSRGNRPVMRLSPAPLSPTRIGQIFLLPHWRGRNTVHHILRPSPAGFADGATEWDDIAMPPHIGIPASSGGMLVNAISADATVQKSAAPGPARRRIIHLPGHHPAGAAYAIASGIGRHTTPDRKQQEKEAVQPRRCEIPSILWCYPPYTLSQLRYGVPRIPRIVPLDVAVKHAGEYSC